MNILNTLVNKKEKKIFEKKDISWYMCGPTVYDHAHIGHARNYIVNDIIRRVLNYKGYNIKMAMNITDIDDKIIRKASEENLDVNVLSQKYEKSFMNDMDNLNVMRPDIITRVTQYIPDIIDYIKHIVNNGYAYQSSSNVYFNSVEYYKKYSNNFNLKLNKESYDQTHNDKKHPQDFVLWKGAKENEPYWDSPWGKGRPGWHIECSAMASDIFGDNFDIHSGGIDLKFPHHENEIKQAIGRYNKSGWVNHFIHIGHLHIDGLKMSKSLKNFITIKEILKSVSSNQLRFLFLMHKYNKKMDYSKNSLEQSNNLLKIFLTFIQNMELLKEDNYGRYDENDIEIMNKVDKIKGIIEDNLDDDFNTPSVVDNLYEIIKIINKYVMGEYKLSIIKNVVEYIKKMLTVFGLDMNITKKDNNSDKIISKLCYIRDKIKHYVFDNKQYGLLKITDEIRDKIAPELDIIIEDKSKYISIWRNRIH